MEKKKYIAPESTAIEIVLEGAVLTQSDISTFELYDETTEDQI